MCSETTTSLHFTVVDVFTNSRYTGNPLAIVLLPVPSEFTPSQSQLQAIAAEFNLFETIFLEQVTPEDIKKGVRRARIFTIKQRAPRELILGAGPIPISPVSSKPGHVSAIIPHNYHHHTARCSAPNLLALHSTLSSVVAENRTFPIVSIVQGMTWILVELQNLEALAAAALGNASANILADSGILDEGWEYNSPIGVYLYVRNAEAEGDGVEVIRTRMLVRGMEDPATGSAASALTGYLALEEADKKGAKRQWKIVQGVEMGRRREIGIRVALANDGIDTIELSGTSVVVSEGMIRV